jgi:hypothetical protein
MLASNLIFAGAALVLAMGTGHLWLTFFSRAFSPRDAELEARMQTAPVFFNKQMLLGKSWTGFNASHSMGPMLFGLIYGYLALIYPVFLLQSHFLMTLGAVTLLFYLFLAWRYWFYLPLMGIALASACYVGGVAAAYGH